MSEKRNIILKLLTLMAKKIAGIVQSKEYQVPQPKQINVSVMDNVKK